MLSIHEQRTRYDVARDHVAVSPEVGGAPEVTGPPEVTGLPELRSAVLRSTAWDRLDGRGVEDLPAMVVAGAWLAIFLVLFGLVTAGLVLGGATVLGWLVWRFRPRRTGGQMRRADRG